MSIIPSLPSPSVLLIKNVVFHHKIIQKDGLFIFVLYLEGIYGHKDKGIWTGEGQYSILVKYPLLLPNIIFIFHKSSNI